MHALRSGKPDPCRRQVSRTAPRPTWSDAETYTELACRASQETFDLNSFWATAIANDIVLTVTASRSGVQQGHFMTTLPFGSYRLPVTLPQPSFTVRAPATPYRARAPNGGA